MKSLTSESRTLFYRKYSAHELHIRVPFPLLYPNTYLSNTLLHEVHGALTFYIKFMEGGREKPNTDMIFLSAIKDFV